MGRGGKKRNKEEKEELSVASLSLTDTQPSTSQQPPSTTSQPSTSQQAPHFEPTPKVETVQSIADEEECIGLGLGETKRRKKRRPKGQGQAAQLNPPQESGSLVTASQTIPVPSGAPQQVPSGAPQQVPSGAPHQVPSDVPQQVPSGAPQQVQFGGPQPEPTTWQRSGQPPMYQQGPDARQPPGPPLGLQQSVGPGQERGQPPIQKSSQPGVGRGRGQPPIQKSSQPGVGRGKGFVSQAATPSQAFEQGTWQNTGPPPGFHQTSVSGQERIPPPNRQSLQPGAGRGRGFVSEPPVSLAAPPSQAIQQGPWQQTGPRPSFHQSSGSGQERRPPLTQQLSQPGAGASRGTGFAAQPSVSQAAASRPPQQGNVVCPFKIPAKVISRTPPMATRIQVLTNYLEMNILPMEVHRYDVTIKPDRPKRLLPNVFQQAKLKYFPKNVIAFDQRKNCYALKMLGANTSDHLDVNVEILDENNIKMPFELTFKHTGIVKFQSILDHMKNKGSSLNSPMEAIQCIDVILQQGTVNKYVKCGRQYFRRPANPIDLTQGLEMWTGLFQSAIFTSRPYVNIDVAHKGFPKAISLVEVLSREFNLDPTKPLDRQRGIDHFTNFVKGIRVTALVAGGTKRREYICNSIVDPPGKITFNFETEGGRNQKMTVEKYFVNEKKCRLRYPNLNCMWVGPRDKTIYYPIELLTIVSGQAINKQLSDKQQPIMVREAATPPNIRMQKIYECMQDMKYSTNEQFKSFGLTISDHFTAVEAKILKPPTLNIGPGRSIEPRRGVWQSNGFVQASSLTSWGIILVEADANNCRAHDMIDLLTRTGQRLGMKVDQPKYTNFNVRMFDLQKTFYAAIDKQVSFLFIVVSGRDKDCYHKVKRMAELEIGMLTQCIKELTACRRMNEQTMRNILLKVNSKLMGINQVLETRSIPNCIKEGSVMIVGADVTHPSPDQSNIPSIAAVTASIDPKCFLYNIEMSIQTPKKEMIMQFEDMMVDHLRIYKARQNSLPKKIYVFRDGVSEGQFAQVMNSEIVALQRAYQRMAGPGTRPEILFLLVQKRHHTRFFTKDRTAQNVEPGTVVDTDIVHPSEMDFYLVSHQAIKGTARPTRYHAVCNDGGVPVDEVEQLAYYLCHLYARCTRSVSYPTPTYYAHLACLRARSLTHGDHFNNNDLESNPKRLRVLDKMLQTSRMFFV